jgi:flagellar biosynthesis anti-sigma factor FlgM
MKGISGNPALDAYQRMKPVSTAHHSNQTQGQDQRPKAASAAKVSISAEAQSLAAGESVNTQKVDALRSAIADGTFKVDSNKVANMMLDGGR